MKSKLVILGTVLIAALVGSCVGDLLWTNEIPYVQWLGYHTSFGFDGISLNFIFMQVSISLHAEIYIIQAILLVVAFVLAPKLDAAIKL